MKRGFVLVAVFALLMFSIANPSLSLIPASIGNEHQEAMFSTAADGDVSSESIGEDYSQKFRETSADDTMTIPDACTLDSTAFTSGKEHRDSFIDNSYITTTSGVALTFDGDLMRVNATGGNGYFGCSFTGDDGVDLEATTYNIVVHVHNVSSVGVRWSMMISLSNTTLYVPFAFNNNTGQSSIETTIDVGFDYYLFYVDDANEHVTLDYVIFTQNPQIDVPDSSHYLEDFADISDITVSVGETVTTDGDLGTFHHPGDNAWDYYFWNDPSALAVQVIEWRCHANISSSSYEFAFYSAGDGGGSQLWTSSSITAPTSAATEKYSPMVTGVESIRLATRHASSPAAFVFDYLRGGLSTEAGWAHDGSTTEGVTNDGEAEITYTTTTDNDILTMTATRTSGSGTKYVDFYVAYDTTTTLCDIERDYYPFVAADCNITLQGGATFVNMQPNIDGKYNTMCISTVTGTFVTSRVNTVPFTANTALKCIRFYSNLDSTGEGFTIEMDWVKAYSIANFTYTPDVLATTSEYFYVDSGVLVSTCTHYASYLNYDPALSVDTNTYNVVNATIDSATGLEWRENVGGWRVILEQETRAEITSGTLTDMIIGGYGSWRLSAIKFWEDATAPTISTFTNTPLDPNTASTVTIETISSDVCGVYTAEATAVVEPSGSSIGTVSMTLDYTTQSGAEIYSYTFSAGDLSEGRYTFELEVDDAANQAYEYLTFTVCADTQTTYIRIFDSLGDFVPFETFEVYRNGTRQYTDTFEGNTGFAYQIQVKDRWGETLNATTFSAGDQELVVTVEVYSLKIMSWHNNFVRFNVTRAGLTYSEIVTPLEVINFRLYTNTYDWAIDYLNGTSTSGDITLTNSTALIVTGSTIFDVLSLVNNLYEMTNQINVTITATNNYVLTISIDLENINSTIGYQLVQVLLNITNTNTTIYSQVVDLLAYLQNVNSTLFDQTVDIIIELNYISSNVTAGFISVSAELSAIDSNLYSNFTSVAAQLLLIDSNLLSNFTELTSELLAVNSTIATQFLSVSATLSMIDSSLLSNFTAITSTLATIGSNITTNYLAITAELALIDSSLAANFTTMMTKLIATNSSLFIQTLAIISDLEFLNATMYLIDDPTHLNPLVLGRSLSDDYCDLTIVTNWHNASISVYDNDVLRTGPTSELLCPIRYPLLATSGTHNLSVYVDGGADSFWYNISYTVAEIIAFELEDWYVRPQLGTENWIECYFGTTWKNATIYVYMNETLQTSILEQEGGISFGFWMTGISGLHNYVFNVTSGAEVKTITWDFYLPDWAETALVVRYDIWTFQDNYTLITLESNWKNCTFYVLLNSSIVATSYNDPVTLNFTRDMNEGTYNLTIHAYGGSQNYTVKNIRYIVTEEGVSYDFSTVTGGVTYVEGDIIYEGDDVVIHENPEGWFMDQGTAAIIAVGSFLVIFTAFLTAREIKQRDREKTEAQYNQ